MYHKQPSLNGFRPFNALRGAGLKRIYDIVLRNDFAICIRYLCAYFILKLCMWRNLYLFWYRCTLYNIFETNKKLFFRILYFFCHMEHEIVMWPYISAGFSWVVWGYFIWRKFAVCSLCIQKFGKNLYSKEIHIQIKFQEIKSFFNQKN